MEFPHLEDSAAVNVVHAHQPGELLEKPFRGLSCGREHLKLDTALRTSRLVGGSNRQDDTLLA